MKQVVHRAYRFRAATPMRTTVRRIIVPLALCAALALAVVAQASGDEQLAPVWATINVCDTGGNQVGARVGVPGDGSGAQIYARFSVEWYSEKQGTWLPVEGVPSSPWLPVGSAALTMQQAGYTFQFEQPADGHPKQIRAHAEVQWRDGASVIRSAVAGTQAGVASDVGGSQAACVLS